MVRFFLYVSIVICLIACNNTPPNSFKLEGSVENAGDSANIILYYLSPVDNEWHLKADTTKIINGKFVFEGNIDDLTAAELCFDDPDVVISARIYLEPTTMKLQIDKNRPYAYELSGTKVEKENRELRKLVNADEKVFHRNLEAVGDILKQIRLNSHNAPVQDSLFYILYQYAAEGGVYGRKMNKTRLDFIARHNTYRIAPDLLYLLTKSDSISLDTIQSVYNNLPEKSKISLMGKLLCTQIEYLKSRKNTSVGNLAPDFTRKDLSGETIRLSDFKNKNYVLLDFWASWCAPCLKEIPKIKKLHNKYSEKGLTIIGISSEEDTFKWSQAIDKYKLDGWSQILNVQNKNNSVFNPDDICFIYDVQEIPHFILIDKLGKIIASGSSEEQLVEIDNILENKMNTK